MHPLYNYYSIILYSYSLTPATLPLSYSYLFVSWEISENSLTICNTRSRFLSRRNMVMSSDVSLLYLFARLSLCSRQYLYTEHEHTEHTSSCPNKKRSCFKLLCFFISLWFICEWSRKERGIEIDWFWKSVHCLF